MSAKKPPFLLRITVHNFRSLRDVDLQLGALNVLVGPNGAGKSNLLDVVRFLGDSVRGDISGALRIRGGYDRIAFRGKPKPTHISLAIEAAVTSNSSKSAPDNYELSFAGIRPRSSAKQSEEWFVVQRKEKFVFKRVAGRGRRITLEGQDLRVYSDDTLELDLDMSESSLALATLPKLGDKAGGKEVEAIAELFASFRVLDIDVGKARLPSTSPQSSVLAEDASNLAAFMTYLASEHPVSFRRLVEDAKAFIPGLTDIALKTAGGAGEGTYVSLLEGALRGETPLADASFGSVRALALLAVLYDPNPPRLTCIEEIDHGLHPYVLDRLVELMRIASEKTQLIIATHSPSLVNRLASSELIVCERAPDGSSIIPSIDADTVRKMERAANGELGLGELWFSGVLGGIPE